MQLWLYSHFYLSFLIELPPLSRLLPQPITAVSQLITSPLPTIRGALLAPIVATDATPQRVNAPSSQI